MPPTVAILGASADRHKFGNKAVRTYLRRGWAVYPINPRGGEIERVICYRSLADVPVRINRVLLYLPPAVGLTLLPAIATAKPDEFYVNPGAESDELLAEAQRLGLDPICACAIVAIGERPDVDED